MPVRRTIHVPEVERGGGPMAGNVSRRTIIKRAAAGAAVAWTAPTLVSVGARAAALSRCGTTNAPARKVCRYTVTDPGRTRDGRPCPTLKKDDVICLSCSTGQTNCSDTTQCRGVRVCGINCIDVKVTRLTAQ